MIERIMARFKTDFTLADPQKHDGSVEKNCAVLIHACARKKIVHHRQQRRQRRQRRRAILKRLKLGDDAHPSSLRSNTRPTLVAKQPGTRTAPVRNGLKRKRASECLFG